MMSYSISIGSKTDFSVKSYCFDKDSTGESRKYNKSTGSHDKFNYDGDYTTDNYGVLLQASTALGSHRLTIGSDLAWGKCDADYTYSKGDRDFSGKQDLYSMFANDEWLIGDKLILSAGVRYDHWKDLSQS